MLHATKYGLCLWACISSALRITDDITPLFGKGTKLQRYNLMLLCPCIMNWLYINYQLDALIIIYS